MEITDGNYQRKLPTDITDGNYRRKLPTEITDGNYRWILPMEITDGLPTEFKFEYPHFSLLKKVIKPDKMASFHINRAKDLTLKHILCATIKEP